MTKAILEKITCIEDLSLFSQAYKKGLINVNISKISKELKKDRKTSKLILRRIYSQKNKRKSKIS